MRTRRLSPLFVFASTLFYYQFNKVLFLSTRLQMMSNPATRAALKVKAKQCVVPSSCVSWTACISSASYLFVWKQRSAASRD